MPFQATLDGGLSWFVVFASFMAQFVVMGIHNVFGILYINLLEEFDQGRVATAWVASISYGLAFVFAPLSSALCKKFGCRLIILTGGVLSGVALFLTSFADSIFHMYISYSLLFGLGCSMCHCSAILILNDYFSKYLAAANGLGVAGGGVGTIALAPALNLLLDSFHWRDTLRILSATSAIFLVSGVIYYFVPAPLDSLKSQTCDEKSNLIDFTVLKNKSFIVWIIVISLIQFGFYTPYVHLVSHAQDVGVPKQKGAVLIGYMAISQSFGKIVNGRIADHPRVNRVTLCQMCLLVCSVVTTLLPLYTNFTSLLVFCLIYGFYDGCFQVLVCVLTMDIAGRKNTVSALGIMYFFLGLALMLGPPVAGWIYSLTGRYEPAFFVTGALTTVGVCLLFLVPLLLPADVTEEWRMRSYGILAVQSREAASEIASLNPSSQLQRSSPICGTNKVSNTSLDKNILETKNEKKNLWGSRISFFLEKYFSMPKIASQVDILNSFHFLKEPYESNFRKETWV